MSKELTPANYEQALAENLFVVELEERLEMVQANEESLAADTVISCCLDS